MDERKQQTSKRHLVLVATAVLGLLTLVSLSIPYDSEAPAMPGDNVHRELRHDQECLSCHVSGQTTAKPMNHPPKANCAFCHVQSTNVR